MAWLKLYDKIRYWQYWDNPIAVGIWIHLLVETAHFDGEISNIGVAVKKGQLAIGTHRFSGEIGINRNTLRYWLDIFEKNGQIKKENCGKYTLITILNWDEYQPEKNHHINHHSPSLYNKRNIRDKRYIPQPSYSSDEDNEAERQEALRRYNENRNR